jgi:integrase
MPRRNSIPAYRLHRQSGQAIVTLPDGLGGRRDFTLGAYNSPESRAEYARLLAEWEANGRRLPQPAAASDLSVNELIVRFWPHVEAHYRHPDGTPTREQEDYKFSLRPLKHLYGYTPAKDFGPRSLKAVRQLMVDGYEHPEFGPQRPLARGLINQRVGRIRRLFRWAVAEELISEPVYRALMAVPGLQCGRSPARETEPVRPVADAVVQVTLPYVRPQVAAMVQLQRHTGMRPGEVVLIRGMDLDTSGNVWFYRPGSDRGPQGTHKTAWRGHQRNVPLGPRAQEILKPWLRLNLADYLFQPREAMAAFRAEQRRNRKTKVQPSQQRRRKARRKKAPGQRYTSRSYAQAIAQGVRAANRAGLCDACKAALKEKRAKEGKRAAFQPCDSCRANQLPHWHPHQLRHTFATEARREFGLDAARAALGHRSPRITDHYAEIDIGKAAEVVARLG